MSIEELKKYCLTKADLLAERKRHKAHCDFLIKKGAVCNCQPKQEK